MSYAYDSANTLLVRQVPNVLPPGVRQESSDDFVSLVLHRHLRLPCRQYLLPAATFEEKWRENIVENSCLFFGTVLMGLHLHA
jgi:hypothetical protein